MLNFLIELLMNFVKSIEGITKNNWNNEKNLRNFGGNIYIWQCIIILLVESIQSSHNIDQKKRNKEWKIKQLKF